MAVDEHFCAKEETPVWGSSPAFLRPHHAIFERLTPRCQNSAQLVTSHLLHIEWTSYLAWSHVFYIFSIFLKSRPKLSKRSYVSCRRHMQVLPTGKFWDKKSGLIFSLKKSMNRLFFLSLACRDTISRIRIESMFSVNIIVIRRVSCNFLCSILFDVSINNV